MNIIDAAQPVRVNGLADSRDLPSHIKDVERCIGKMYEDGGPTPRTVTLTKEGGWPEMFDAGRLIDLEVKAKGRETFRLFGEVIENDGENLTVDARVVGERPVTVWVW